MSGPFGSSQWMYQSAAGFYPYQIEQSLRFNDDDSAYLSRTPASAGNRKTFTFSAWVKPSAFGKAQPVFSAYTDSQNYSVLGFDLSGFIGGGDSLKLWTGISNVTICAFTTNAVFRDPSAWYHIVVATDTTQATSTDRVKIYVNGSQITSFATSTYPSLNADAGMVNATTAHQIGALASGTYGYFDGYMAEVNFIDGTALDPTSFGETKSGIWIPKAYAGSYGTNGFYLSFADSAAIGDDLSGNGNDWTANNLVSTDVLLDSPTNNWCVLNPLQRGTSTTLSEGNLRFTSSQTYAVVLGSIGVTSGKWYWEGLTTTSASAAHFGIGNPNTNTNTYLGLGIDFGYSSSGIIYGPNDTTTQSGLATYTTGDIIGVTMDMDAGEVKFYKNNSLIATVSSVNTSVPRFPALSDNSSANNPDLVANFGQDSSFAGNKTAQGNTDANGVGDFFYAPPSGFLALCTANLPDPVIDPAQDDVPADYFNTVPFAGNSSGASVTGVGFQPDFVWMKCRSTARNHELLDAVRGGSSTLFSNLTSAEATQQRISSFDSDGFTYTTDSNSANTGDTYVAWNWLAGNGTASNTDGSITSTVSVNQKAGFSVVGFTQLLASGSYGHGLGATPELMIRKRRDDATSWGVWHKDFTVNEYLFLQTTDAKTTFTGAWNTLPTDTLAYVRTPDGTDGGAFSGPNTAWIAYHFVSVEGYSKIGSYTGNGSTDGPFVYCGFRPAFLIYKRSDAGGNSWIMYDAKRDTYNVTTNYLEPSASNAESSDLVVDFVSNGFKVRESWTGANASGGTYIFMAFAEQPFKFSNAR